MSTETSTPTTHPTASREEWLTARTALLGCPSCSLLSDHIDGPRRHLEQHDVSVVAISRGPIDRIEAYRKRMGWGFPWVSSLHNDFNFDLGVSFTPERRGGDGTYNYGPMPDEYNGETPGMSSLALQDGVVHHTYSAYARGGEALMGIFSFLDRAPQGRNEGGLDFPMGWVRRHDEYPDAAAAGCDCGS